ncbi:hypothetical protein [Thermus albus]|uniref:hypothetical protein n=1 Tax=Thermus albus TaxID=2908146 RepID=UPI001FA969DC|nr:hypothetical protein [Thermus albus]
MEVMGMTLQEAMEHLERAKRALAEAERAEAAAEAAFRAATAARRAAREAVFQLEQVVNMIRVRESMQVER